MAKTLLGIFIMWAAFGLFTSIVHKAFSIAAGDHSPIYVSLFFGFGLASALGVFVALMTYGSSLAFGGKI